MSIAQLAKIRELHAMLREVLPVIERYAGVDRGAEDAYRAICEALGETPHTIEPPAPFIDEPLGEQKP